MYHEGMNTRIKITNYESTPEVHSYLETRIADVAKLVHGGAPLYEVELSKVTGEQHGEIYCAEINLSHDGQVYRAVHVAENMNAAIDQVKDELMRQLRKEKTKHESAFRKGARMVKEWLRFGSEE